MSVDRRLHGRLQRVKYRSRDGSDSGASRGACCRNYRREFAVPLLEDRLNCWGRVGKNDLNVLQYILGFVFSSWGKAQSCPALKAGGGWESCLFLWNKDMVCLLGRVNQHCLFPWKLCLLHTASCLLSSHHKEAEGLWRGKTNLHFDGFLLLWSLAVFPELCIILFLLLFFLSFFPTLVPWSPLPQETGSTSIQAADSTAVNGSITPTDKK